MYLLDNFRQLRLVMKAGGHCAVLYEGGTVVRGNPKSDAGMLIVWRPRQGLPSSWVKDFSYVVSVAMNEFHHGLDHCFHQCYLQFQTCRSLETL